MFFAILIAGTTFLHGQRGKLSGEIRDAQTGERLIGVAVRVDGTTLGGVTDIDGNYFILNIPAGKYSVTASYVGYAKYVVSDVEIFIDRTTTIDMKLKQATLEMEEVVVVAEKPKIIKDQTSTATTIDNEQIEAAPIEGLRGILDLTAGFSKNEKGTYTVRGSGTYDVNYQINGVDQINSATTSPGSFGVEKADNSWKYDINPIGVQQMQLISGGFSAEYGNAQAGVVKVVLKDGTSKLSGEFRVEYRPPGQYHFGKYIYDESTYEWQKWGTLDKWMALKDSSFFLQDLGLNSPSRYKWLYDKVKNGTASPDEVSMWNNILNNEINWAFNTWLTNHSPSDDNPLGVYDYRSRSYQRFMIGIGGPLGKNPDRLKFFFSGEYKKNPTRLPTAEKDQISQNYTLNVTYQPAISHKLKLLLGYQNYRGGIWSGSNDIRWAGLAFSPPSTSYKYYVLIDPVRTEETVTQSLNYTYTINPQSFLEATVTHLNEKYELPYEYLPSYSQQRDVLDSLNDPIGSILKPGAWWETQYFRAPDAFSTLYYQDTRTEYWAANIDFTSQFNQFNLFKAGFKFYYWDLYNNGVNSRFKANALVATNGVAEYYTAQPYNVAFYIQDKMEYEGMIANIGVRAEAYNFGADVPVDPFNIVYVGTEGPETGNLATEKSKTYFMLLPRVGLSFPIGENTAFRLQYGHFTSMPTFSQALSNRGNKGIVGHGNANLEPKKTIQYEFGLQQLLDEDNRIDLALYYNDRVSQIGLLRYASFTGTVLNSPSAYTSDNTPLFNYTTFANNAFGATLGFEATLEKVNPKNWMYRLTYSISQTTDGNYGAQVMYPTASAAAESRDYTGEFLSGNDRTHNLRALLQYNWGTGEGPELFGLNILENSSISFIYSVQSGAPFTYRTSFDLKDIVNNRRYPIESNFDVNFTKNIILEGGYRFIVGLRIMNLFNNQWITPVTGNDLIDWVDYGTTIDQPGRDPNRISYISAFYKAYKNIPRQVFLTLGFGF
ncbi:MAG: TonB-dependent receptor [Ignavibacteriales bacterium]|nr:TonB-dependent receptor [Ignavibacteria bacterium]MBZ0195950.1 TonB-dependent receptor [Ignavibacteriaceae bacterium]MCZ2144264.1 TonB-dependent receptor [Ignavibacteriales bacterium]WKZ73022.1 MAG: TonB-dependent receptor [Ignavibacteriaceae bacterium]